MKILCVIALLLATYSLTVSGLVGGGYQCEVSDLGRRIHETTQRTSYDCRDKSCGNTCLGGQCVAYVTCRCKRPGSNDHPPRTSCWRPGAKVTLEGQCNSDIPKYTAIATFKKNSYYAGHAGVFMGCINDYTIQLYDQMCCRSIGFNSYRQEHPFYDDFYVVEKPVECQDRPSWPCRLEDAGSTCCPVSVSRCKRRAYWYDSYGLDEEEDPEPELA